MACLGPCQPALSFAQIQALWIAQGGDPSQASTAAAIALAESGGVPNALGDGGDSVGLWQIDTAFHPGLDYNGLTNPKYNVLQAINISGNGRNWTPWSTYCGAGNGANCQMPGTGTFRRYLAQNGGTLPSPAGGSNLLDNIEGGVNAIVGGVDNIAGGIFNDIGSGLQALFGGSGLVSPFLRLPQSLINIGWDFGGFCIGMALILIGGLLLASSAFEDIASSIEKAADAMQDSNNKPGAPAILTNTVAPESAEVVAAV